MELRHLPLVLLPVLVLGCKGPGHASGPPAGPLTQAPPPTVTPGWIPVGSEVGFTIAFPPGWKLSAATRKDIEEYVALRNENAWTAMNERKADVDLDKAKGLYGLRSTFELGAAYEGIATDQSVWAIREELGRDISLEEAVARWRDTIFGGSAPPKLKEKDVQLPVGKVKTLTAASAEMGIAERTVLYFIVDGPVQYTFFFGEQATDKGEPIPIEEIMATFRPAN